MGKHTPINRAAILKQDLLSFVRERPSNNKRDNVVFGFGALEKIVLMLFNTPLNFLPYSPDVGFDLATILFTAGTGSTYLDTQREILSGQLQKVLGSNASVTITREELVNIIRITYTVDDDDVVLTLRADNERVMVDLITDSRYDDIKIIS